MATVSIEKGISLNSNAVENIVKIFNESNKVEKKSSIVDTTEEVKRGNDLLNRLFSR